MVKAVKPVGGRQDGKMLKPTGAKLMRIVKLTGAIKRQNGQNGTNGKTGRAQAKWEMLKPAGPQIDANGTMAKPLSALKMVKLVKW